ncbi:PEPxxWA-CTERM sorting domain-containing protein [Sphingomonas abaci]|uniref:Ice-binding protein C-terminal domain-containing protein n=1 Tax=Sphingomonas abaci TaxID=237611 RepID=A0A7W7EZ24_9SPHN|nr:PEPxxWA-CTERM sorting domain-containing protein [Sphingomonas abaci]MBB4619383.1 hypothetical protein [Sphingomonas abaci]
MKYNLTLAAAAAFAAVACPAAASAADFRFTVTGDYSASWILSDTAELVSASNQGFSIADVAGTFPGSVGDIAYLDFFSAGNGGGLTIWDNDVSVQDPLAILANGAQLYTGTYTGPAWTPTWKTGAFAFTGNNGTGSYTLTVAQVASAIPEPSTWALAILGMALVGGALRRRRTQVTVRYA